MENRRRAFRRWKQHVKFLRRLKMWIKPGATRYIERDEFGYPLIKSRAGVIKEALQGKCYTFLRTTSCPCNCWMCSGEYKYKRPSKSELNKHIWDEIDWEIL